MRDIILFIAVLAYMIGGYFVVGIIGEFFDKNYKGFNYDDEQSDKPIMQNGENADCPLRKN